MPTYEFRCPDGHEFTRFYKTISAGVSELPCPECGKTATRQLSGGAGLVFKGSGFYLTDYGKNAHRKVGPSAPSTGKSEQKHDSKTDAVKSESTSDTAKPQTAKAESKAESAKPKADSSTPKAKPE